jgi:hypothetical protein
MAEEKQHPLVLVFYLDIELLSNREIAQPFVDMVNDVIAQKDSNAVAFFLPTRGEERIECINPVVMAEPDMAKVTQMIEDIKEQFSIAAEMDVLDEEITPDDNPCECGGNCKCDKTE